MYCTNSVISFLAFHNYASKLDLQLLKIFSDVIVAYAKK